MRKCRAAAPSHVHGACWTPAKLTAHEWPYFVDNGAFGGNFDTDAWIETLDEAGDRLPHSPDFVVLPDVFNDAEATIERHREHADIVSDRGFEPATVLQPGLSVSTQVSVADELGAETLFVGGECRWQRAHGSEIVETAHGRGLRVHIGNPGSADGLVWAYRVGFDSVDTSSILQNQNFDWLKQLEEATRDSSDDERINGGVQSMITEVAGDD